MNQSPIVYAGAALILFGLLGFAVPIFTTQQTSEVAHIGDLKLQATETRSYAIPTLLSGGAIVVGFIILGAGLYRRT